MKEENEFKSWCDRCGYDRDTAADHLGVTKYEATIYETAQEHIPQRIKERMHEHEKLLISLARQRGKDK